MRKAMGLLTSDELKKHPDWHNHNVPPEVVDNLVGLVADPVAILKGKAGKYLAVLDEKVGEEQIVAIISPSKKGDSGFTFMPTAYEKDPLEKMLQEAKQKNAILYIDKTRAPKPGLSVLTSIVGENALTNSILTKEDVVKGNFILADGKKRHARNSEGDMIHASVQGLRNFWKFFGDSVVADEQGRPLVVYHGTDADFNAFDMSKGRANMDIKGAFFSPWELDAKGYGKNVRPFYLSIKNPADEQTAYKALKKYQGQNNAGEKAKQDLIEQGYDGVNNHNEEYIAFEPTQIKSINNQGTFDAQNPNIYHQAVQNNQNPNFEQELKGLFEAPKGIVKKAVIGNVSSALVNIANEKGLKIEGYVHNIDSSAIRHTHKRHGVAPREERRGQIAVSNEDYKTIPSLIYKPDFIAFGAKNDKGFDLIIYGKNMPDGSSLYIEEVRTGKRTLTTKSLKKYKTGVNPSSFAKRISNAHGNTGTISVVTKEDIVKAQREHTASIDDLSFKQGAGNKANFRGKFNAAANTITLSPQADASTLMHEMAHYFLAERWNFIRSGQADEAYKKDFAVLAKFLGIKEGQEELSEKQHELFARSFESYLLEGKAPSLELGPENQPDGPNKAAADHPNANHPCPRERCPVARQYNFCYTQ